MKGLKKLWGRAAGRRAVLAACTVLAAMALTMCDAPTMWQGVSSTASGAGALSGIRFTESPEPQNYTEGRTAAPVMKAQISAPPAVTRLTVKWYREKDVLRLQWNKDTATEVAAQSLFAEGYTPEGDNTFDTAYTLTADDLKVSGTYYYYAVVEDAIYSAPAMAQINTLGPAVSAVSGGASYQPTTSFVQALSATVTLPADNTAETLSYQWFRRNDSVEDSVTKKVDVKVEEKFTRLDDGRWSYRFEHIPSLEGLTVGETYEYNLEVSNSHGTTTSPQGARVKILTASDGDAATAYVAVLDEYTGDITYHRWTSGWNYDMTVVTPVNLRNRAFKESDGVVRIKNTAGDNVIKFYEVTGAGTTPLVVEPNVSVEVLLNNASVTPASGSPIDIAPTAELTLLLSKTNTLTANGASAGVHVPFGASLTIDSAAGTGSVSGVLYANGRYEGAGIGGNYSEAAGSITIKGGAVYAYAEYPDPEGIGNKTYPGAGIGSGAWAVGATIRIQGGVVVAYSKSGTITKPNNGETATILHYFSGAGIGSGAGFDGANSAHVTQPTTIDITGGTVIAGSASVGFAGPIGYETKPAYYAVDGIGYGYYSNTVPEGYINSASAPIPTITISERAVVLATSINHTYPGNTTGQSGVLAADTVVTFDWNYFSGDDLDAGHTTVTAKNKIYAEARRRSEDVMALGGTEPTPLTEGAFILNKNFTVPANATFTVPPGWTLYLNDNVLNGSSGNVSGNISPGKPTMQ